MRRAGWDWNIQNHYECSFLATGGNVFNLSEIDHCISTADYNPEDPQFLHNLNYPKAMGVDPGYGTSKGAYMITQLRNGVIEILKAEEINRESHSFFANAVYSEIVRYSIENIYADPANPGFINGIKNMIGETTYEIMKRTESVEYGTCCACNLQPIEQTNVDKCSKNCI